MGSLVQKLRYKADKHGRVFEEINPAYTSQRCNRCGYIHKSNRKSQVIFVCGKCGHKDNADCNAAKNILDYEIWLPEQTAMWNARSMKSL